MYLYVGVLAWKHCVFSVKQSRELRTHSPLEMPDVFYMPVATISLRWGKFASDIIVLGIAMHEITIEHTRSLELRIAVKRILP